MGGEHILETSPQFQNFNFFKVIDPKLWGFKGVQGPSSGGLGLVSFFNLFILFF